MTSDAVLRQPHLARRGRRKTEVRQAGPIEVEPVLLEEAKFQSEMLERLNQGLQRISAEGGPNQGPASRHSGDAEQAPPRLVVEWIAIGSKYRYADPVLLASCFQREVSPENDLRQALAGGRRAARDHCNVVS